MTVGRSFWETISSLVILERILGGIYEKIIFLWKFWRFTWKGIFVYAIFWHLAKEVFRDPRQLEDFLGKKYFFFAIDIRQEESFFLGFWTVEGFSWNSAALSEWYWTLKEENNILIYLKRTLRRKREKDWNSDYFRKRINNSDLILIS